ncbi:hypothetical protein HYU19_02490 [Candidatus Woesearchaeota archaeon]|nr:hypothetical protein [Candidatus Woesearchaeota archaeon]
MAAERTLRLLSKIFEAYSTLASTGVVLAQLLRGLYLTPFELSILISVVIALLLAIFADSIAD